MHEKNIKEKPTGVATAGLKDITRVWSTNTKTNTVQQKQGDVTHRKCAKYCKTYGRKEEDAMF